MVQGFENGVLSQQGAIDVLQAVTDSPLVSGTLSAAANATNGLAPFLRTFTVRAPNLYLFNSTESVTFYCFYDPQIKLALEELPPNQRFILNTIGFSMDPAP